MENFTTDQKTALVRLHARECKRSIDDGFAAPLYADFAERFRPMIGGGGCIIGEALGLTFGIEADGYTHT